jgi:biotin carboxyl carrier protein
MYTEEIKKFVELLRNTDIDELYWESDDLKLSLKRSELAMVPQQPVQTVEQQAVSPGVNGAGGNGKKTFAIKSPMVGRFYR